MELLLPQPMDYNQAPPPAKSVMSFLGCFKASRQAHPPSQASSDSMSLKWPWIWMQFYWGHQSHLKSPCLLSAASDRQGEEYKGALNPEVGSSPEEIIFHRGLPEWFLFLFWAKSDPRTMGPIQSVFKAVNATTLPLGFLNKQAEESLRPAPFVLIITRLSPGLSWIWLQWQWHSSTPILQAVLRGMLVWSHSSQDKADTLSVTTAAEKPADS